MPITNPNLQWDGKSEFITWQTPDLSSIKTVTIERPTGWQYVYEPQEAQPNNVPDSLHIDDGMKLTYGYGKFKAGYGQLLAVPAQQRLLVKVVYTLETGSPDQIYGQIIVDGALGVHSDRTLLRGGTEKLFLFKAASAGNITLKFLASADYAVNPTILSIHAITLEEVAEGYGDPVIPVVVPIGAGTPAPTPIPAPVPAPQPVSVPTPFAITLPLPDDPTPAALYKAIAAFYTTLAASFEVS